MVTSIRRRRRRHAAFAVLIAFAIAITSCAPAATPGDEATTALTAATTARAAPTSTAAAAPAPRESHGPIVVGVEYILLDNPRIIERQAELLGEVGFRASKPIAEAFDWGTMQPGPNEPIDFTKLDTYVREFQAAGFDVAVLALKSHSTWASVDHAPLRSNNAAPKPEYRDLYAQWVRAIVERYDGDGVDDMDGLLFPVTHYEIGSEFSSYEPEPVDDYLVMLQVAYESAHDAFPDVVVGHAAFLVTDFLLGDPDPATLDDGTGVDRYGPHTFSEIRAILDRPDLFDVLNVHALAHPGEIEQMVRWLDWEMDQRGYRKPIIISDTSINPFISFGPAIDCERVPQLMGLTFYPATDDDRCRLADYFKRVLDGDEDTVEWMRGYVAADMVKKVVIAAEQGIELINTAFTTDLPLLDSRLGQAGAGNAGWGGMIHIPSGTTHANFHAMKQLLGHIDGYSSVERLDVTGAEGTRVYRFAVDGRGVFVAWYDPPFLVLHGDDAETSTITFDAGADSVAVESMIAGVGQTEPDSATGATDDGKFDITLDQSPVYVIPTD